MKALKLDARFEGARRLAECLAGNYTTILIDPYGDYGKLVCVLQDINEFVIWNGDLDTREVIYIHCSDLKFCPFIAMKNRISVFAPKGNTRGRITLIEDCESVQIGWNPEATYFLHEIELDTNNLLEGAEIVEL